MNRRRSAAISARKDGDFFYVDATDPGDVADRVVDLVARHIPRRFGFDPARDIQVHSPMQRGGAGARALNILLQTRLNLPSNTAIEKIGQPCPPACGSYQEVGPVLDWTAGGVGGNMYAREPWALYGADRPASGGRLLLCEVLMRFAEVQFGIHDADIRFALLGDDEGAETADTLRSTMTFLGQLMTEGNLRTAVRRFGGGECEPFPPDKWEIDDFEPRFAVSAVDPVGWSDPDAAPTHWIFVNASDFEAFLTEWCRTDDPAYVLAPAASSSAAGVLELDDGGRYPDAIIRMPEVARLTGLSRSTIYAKIALGTFPAQITLGSRMAGWYQRQVVEWLRSPR